MHEHSQAQKMGLPFFLLTLTVLGGGGAWEPPPPPSTFSEIAPQPLGILNCRFMTFFPSSLMHMLIPFSSKSDIPVRCYITISMSMSSKSAIIAYIHVQANVNTGLDVLLPKTGRYELISNCFMFLKVT